MVPNNRGQLTVMKWWYRSWKTAVSMPCVTTSRPPILYATRCWVCPPLQLPIVPLADSNARNRGNATDRRHRIIPHGSMRFLAPANGPRSYYSHMSNLRRQAGLVFFAMIAAVVLLIVITLAAWYLINIPDRPLDPGIATNCNGSMMRWRRRTICSLRCSLSIRPMWKTSTSRGGRSTPRTWRDAPPIQDQRHIRQCLTGRAPGIHRRAVRSVWTPGENPKTASNARSRIRKICAG